MRAFMIFRASLVTSVCILALACGPGDSKPGKSTGGGKKPGGKNEVVNTAPVLKSAAIDSIPYDTLATIAVVPGATTDAEDDTVTLVYQWFVNGSAVSGATADKLEGTQFSRGDEVFAEITPSDGKLSGKAVRSNSVTIDNTAPGTADALLYPAFATTDSLLWADLTQPAVDIDGDALTYQYAWYKNGAAQSFASTQTTVAAALTVTGDTWKVDVRAQDGTTLGAAISRSVFIHRTMWAYSLGATNAEFGRAATRATGGDWVVVGDTSTFGAGTDAWLTRFRSNGQVAWARRIGGPNVDKAHAVAATDDDGFIVAGDTQSFGAVGQDIFIARFDASGELVWAKMLGGPSADYMKSIVATADGNFVLLIKTDSFGGGAWVVKIDGAGAILWQTRVPDFTASSLVGLSNGKLVVAGLYGSRAAVALLSSTGVISWKSVFGQIGGSGSVINRVAETSNGELIGVGNTTVFTGTNVTEGWVVRLDSLGAIEWQKRLISGHTNLLSIVRSPTGFGIAGALSLSGDTDRQFLAGEVDETGRLRWSRSFGGAGMEEAAGLLPVGNDGYLYWGSTLTVGAGGNDFFLANASAAGDTQFSAGSLIAAASHTHLLSDTSSLISAPTVTFPSASATSALMGDITTATVADTSWTQLKLAP